MLAFIDEQTQNEYLNHRNEEQKPKFNTWNFSNIIIYWISRRIRTTFYIWIVNKYMDCENYMVSGCYSKYI